MLLGWLYLFLILGGIAIGYIYFLDIIAKIILWSLVLLIPLIILSCILGSFIGGLGVCCFIGFMTYYFQYD